VLKKGSDPLSSAEPGASEMGGLPRFSRGSDPFFNTLLGQADPAPIEEATPLRETPLILTSISFAANTALNAATTLESMYQSKRAAKGKTSRSAAPAGQGTTWAQASALAGLDTLLAQVQPAGNSNGSHG